LTREALDADGNLLSLIDSAGNATKRIYDKDNSRALGAEGTLRAGFCLRRGGDGG
jgi:hypothetical protein